MQDINVLVLAVHLKGIPSPFFVMQIGVLSFRYFMMQRYQVTSYQRNNFNEASNTFSESLLFLLCPCIGQHQNDDGQYNDDACNSQL